MSTTPSASRTTPSPDRSESGSVSVVMVFTILVTLLLGGLVFNIAHSIFEKIDLQNRADLVALTVGKRQAIAMNKVVELNHRAGEQLARAVVPLALVGSGTTFVELSAAQRADARNLAGRIGDGARTLRSLGSETAADEPMGGELPTGGALGEALIGLRRRLVEEYDARIAAGGGAPIQEPAILEEWRALARLADRFEPRRPTALVIVGEQVPETLRAARILIEDRPRKALRIAQIAGELNEVTPGLFPWGPGLPVVPEAPALGGDAVAGFAGSQIVAATWPWVLVGRAAILDELEPLRLSGAARIFEAWTVRATAELAQAIYRDHGVAMHVMAQSRPGSKGTEPWTRDPEAADRLFSVVVLAHRPARQGLAATLFPPASPDGTVTHAQFFLHSASPQEPGPIAGPLQPNVSWDTLNWAVRVAAFPHDGPVRRPVSRPRWAARINPVTRFDECADRSPEPFRGLLEPLAPLSRELQTH